MTKVITPVSVVAWADGRHIFYSYKTLQVISLGLALGLRVFVTPLLLVFQTLDSLAYIAHEIPS